MFFKSRIASFKYAFQGFAPVFQKEYNIYIHSAIAALVIAFGIFFELTPLEWIMIVFAIGFVFVCEFINSAIERLANLVEPNQHSIIKQVKDISAAAVLISACTAVIIGLIIFIPKIIFFIEKIL